MVLDFLLVALGFCLIVVVHELGHFLAAKWAGIRVLAFAVGFGPAVASYRKGVGFRLGSGEADYAASLRSAGGSLHSPPTILPGISPTEYRLNALPLGGYVKMLGQVDADPGQVSDAPDSYQNAPIWKRMIVISAGVVANVILAACLFGIVFLVGLNSPAPTIGYVEPGSPAASARIIDATGHDVGPGLRAGDRVTRMDGWPVRHFQDIAFASALASPRAPVDISFVRDGVAMRAEATPRMGTRSRMLELGVAPTFSTRLVDPKASRASETVRTVLRERGLNAVEPGMTLTRANGRDVRTLHEFEALVQASNGGAIEVEFRGDDGSTVRASLTPRPEMEVGYIPDGEDGVVGVEHLLGLTPVLAVADAAPEGTTHAAADKGFQDGDVIARVGEAEYPTPAEGRRAIRARAGRTVDVIVLRRSDDGTWREVSLPDVPVSRDGGIGFIMGDRGDVSTLVGRAPEEIRRSPTGADGYTPPAAGIVPAPGVSVVAINDTPTPNFTAVREALREATRGTFERGEASTGESATVRVTFRHPVNGVPGADGRTEVVEWTLPADAVRTLHTLRWSSPLPPGLFEQEMVVVRGDGPVDAVGIGLHETHRVMLSTYLTFVRIAQGSVKVEHLKGPVGIAHLGTLVAGRGFVWLLFFLALISINLAVINFLPLPIVDGGQFLFLLYEQVRGRPAPIGLQNALTIAGLALIASVFLFVTFNDVRNLLGM
ncbi:MAG: site-2 protease family protein [Planctomycetota bacterium]|nr:site-2 protease family protein [Planctomycetota bacterium]